MRKMTAAMAALGVVAGLGAAALPLSSYATDATVPVTAVIDESLSISLTDALTTDGLGADGVLIEGVVPGQSLKSKTIGVTVSGDAGASYTLKMEDRLADTALINENGVRIATGTDLSDGASASAWGYSRVASATATPSTWSAVPARGNGVSILSGATGTIAEGGKSTSYVAFGVHAIAGQASGRYTSDVIFTAQAN